MNAYETNMNNEEFTRVLLVLINKRLVSMMTDNVEVRAINSNKILTALTILDVTEESLPIITELSVLITLGNLGDLTALKAAIKISDELSEKV